VGGPGVYRRSSVGLDVDVRSVVAAAIDGHTGEVFRKRLTPGNDDVIGWVGSLPGPSAVVYEAGPTGFGLVRAFATEGSGVRLRRHRGSSVRLVTGLRRMLETPLSRRRSREHAATARSAVAKLVRGCAP
jgi:hypothetical protein